MSLIDCTHVKMSYKTHPECLRAQVSKLRYRADQLFYGKVELEDGEIIGYVSVLESGSMQDEADKAADKMKRKAAKQVWTTRPRPCKCAHFHLCAWAWAS